MLHEDHGAVPIEVPQFDVSIQAAGHDLSAVGRGTHTQDRLFAHRKSDRDLLSRHVPKLHGAVPVAGDQIPAVTGKAKRVNAGLRILKASPFLSRG